MTVRDDRRVIRMGCRTSRKFQEFSILRPSYPIYLGILTPQSPSARSWGWCGHLCLHQEPPSCPCLPLHWKSQRDRLQSSRRGYPTPTGAPWLPIPPGWGGPPLAVGCRTRGTAAGQRGGVGNRGRHSQPKEARGRNSTALGGSAPTAQTASTYTLHLTPYPLPL